VEVAEEGSAREFQLALDRFYRTSAQSPLTSSQKKSFEGLSFFPIDSGWVLRARWEPLPNRLPVELPTNKPDAQSEVRGSQVPYLRIFFDKDGQEYQLTAYQLLDSFGLPLEDTPLFLPFADLTNGVETYGGGRYLDLPYPSHPAQPITVDFNRSYHPYCAYNEDYICPLVPPKNTLGIRVEAGIRLASDLGPG